MEKQELGMGMRMGMGRWNDESMTMKCILYCKPLVLSIGE